MRIRILTIILGVFLPFYLTGEIAANSDLSAYDLVVAKDGSGDFISIQDAIDSSKAFPKERVLIFIKSGEYQEKVRVPSWNTKLSLIGEDARSTIITWGDYFKQIDRGRNSTFFTYTLKVEANDFYAENLTIINSAGDIGQAVAVHVEGDRVYFENCRFIGNQDTLYSAGENARQYFKDCYIEGTTDFIFGEATAVFEDGVIHSKKNSYITAASTSEGTEFGFVFLNVTLTAENGLDKVYLGRPWRDHAKTVFINSNMAGHILPVGWHNWSRPEAEPTVYYAEFNSTGAGASSSERVEWSHQLTTTESGKYTTENIFGNWNPQVNKSK